MTSLSDLTTLRLGGRARRLIECRTEAEIVEAVREVDAAGDPLLILGGGSNLVVADEGFPGTVVRILTRGVDERQSGETVRLEVAAGEPWEPLVERCVAEGLAGFEWLSGIPGLTGATPIQNVGAYGGEVKNTVVSVRVYDREQHRVVEMSAAECGFGYRTSVFKRTPGRWVVLAVGFALRRGDTSGPIAYPELARAMGCSPGDTAPIADVRLAVLALRNRKGMVLAPDDPDTFSAGSFFLNPLLTPQECERLLCRVREHNPAADGPPLYPQEDGRVKTSAAWLIDRAGFHRGYGDPHGIAISSKHTLALTNRGNGTTAELLVLACEIVEGVEERFGVRLQPEPVLVGVPIDAGAPDS